MVIQIDRQHFLPLIFQEHGWEPNIPIPCGRLSSAVLTVAQGWFDDPPFKRDKKINTQRECRMSLKYCVLQEIDLKDKNNSFFLPNFGWIREQQKISSYIVKLLIEYYWRNSDAQAPSLYKQILAAHYDVD